jgi:threonylcarbamoyladenosine tRNA methylthiotransferase MtaB
MPRFFVSTLGCKLNQHDSSRAEGALLARGFEPAARPEDADLILLNTCTVTARADSDARRLARRFRRLNPSARIVATGCYAEREPEALDRLGVLDDLVGLRQRDRLGEALTGEPGTCGVGEAPVRLREPARALVRVQEGCDLRCSYCVIPQVRGPSRSIPAQEVIAEVSALAARGVREVGLTGINTGAWGADLDPRRRLADLLADLLAATRRVHIRLNSVEPPKLDDALIELLAGHPDRLVPHLHVPLQSGSDAVLARMSRPYRAADYRRAVERAASRIPHLGLGADVMTGFPGETEDDHRVTRELLSDLPVTYLHVFSYSRRPGTRAASLGPAVPERVVGERTRALRALGAEKASAFRRSLLGQVRPALTLHARADDGSVRALTDNYVEVLVAGAPEGERLNVELTSLDEDGHTVRGRWIRDPADPLDRETAE